MLLGLGLGIFQTPNNTSVMDSVPQDLFHRTGHGSPGFSAPYYEDTSLVGKGYLMSPSYQGVSGKGEVIGHGPSGVHRRHPGQEDVDGVLPELGKIRHDPSNPVVKV